MLFSITVFIFLFLPGVLFFYYVLFRKNRSLQNGFLFLSSLFFYAWGEPLFVLVMIASICLNWLAGLGISRSPGGKARKRLLIASICFNLSLLFVFKYLGFSCRILKDALGFPLSIPEIALPIGISFFTFQAMSYVIDVYRRQGEAQKSILSVGLYISFFPQLIAGPIVRYETIAREIQHRRETAEDFYTGFTRFILGLAKKVLLANSFAFLADKAFATEGARLSVCFGWLGAIAYTLQIYYDFSGYSDMAIGLGRMFGFHFLENFNYPYCASSITDFWRRWHMSLGSWFRDYLYIPLGGSRCSRSRNYLNLFLVWALTGLWHGADFTFLAWGMLYFFLLLAEKSSGLYRKKGPLLTPLKHCLTMFFVVLGWVLFRSETMSGAVDYLRAMFGLMGNPFTDGIFAAWLSQNAVLLVLGICFCTPALRRLHWRTRDKLLLNWMKTALLLALFSLSLASLVSSAYNPFIYFNF